MRVKRTLDVHDETATNDKEERACFSRGFVTKLWELWEQPRRSRFCCERQAHVETRARACALTCES
jgi:hypothetical protein